MFGEHHILCILGKRESHFSLRLSDLPIAIESPRHQVMTIDILPLAQLQARA
jgi:hypothetical protein